eukprot:2316578-Rhodomonas_salina.2
MAGRDFSATEESGRRSAPLSSLLPTSSPPRSSLPLPSLSLSLLSLSLSPTLSSPMLFSPPLLSATLLRPPSWLRTGPDFARAIVLQRIKSVIVHTVFEFLTKGDNCGSSGANTCMSVAAALRGARGHGKLLPGPRRRSDHRPGSDPGDALWLEAGTDCGYAGTRTRLVLTVAVRFLKSIPANLKPHSPELQKWLDDYGWNDIILRNGTRSAPIRLRACLAMPGTGLVRHWPSKLHTDLGYGAARLKWDVDMVFDSEEEDNEPNGPARYLPTRTLGLVRYWHRNSAICLRDARRCPGLRRRTRGVELGPAYRQKRHVVQRNCPRVPPFSASLPSRLLRYVRY